MKRVGGVLLRLLKMGGNSRLSKTKILGFFLKKNSLLVVGDLILQEIVGNWRFSFRPCLRPSPLFSHE